MCPRSKLRSVQTSLLMFHHSPPLCFLCKKLVIFFFCLTNHAFPSAICPDKWSIIDGNMLHFYVPLWISAHKSQVRNYHDSHIRGQGHEIDQGEIFLIKCLIFTSCADIRYSVRWLGIKGSQMFFFFSSKTLLVSPLKHMYEHSQWKMLLLRSFSSFRYSIESQLCVIYVSTVYLVITPIQLIGKYMYKFWHSLL